MNPPSFLPALACTLPFLLFAIGCGHTNELARYPTEGKVVDTESRFTASAVNVSVDAGTENKTVVDVLIEVGSAAAAFKAMEKISSAVQPEGIAMAVSERFTDEAIRSLRLARWSIAGPEPDFTIRTLLRALEFRSRPDGLFTFMNFEISILARGGALVWQYAREGEVPMREKDRSRGPFKSGGIISGISHAIALGKLSEREIQDAVLYAAEGFTEEFLDVLRDDAEDLPR